MRTRSAAASEMTNGRSNHSDVNFVPAWFWVCDISIDGHVPGCRHESSFHDATFHRVHIRVFCTYMELRK